MNIKLISERGEQLVSTSALRSPDFYEGKIKELQDKLSEYKEKLKQSKINAKEKAKGGKAKPAAAVKPSKPISAGKKAKITEEIKAKNQEIAKLLKKKPKAVGMFGQLRINEQVKDIKKEITALKKQLA